MEQKIKAFFQKNKKIVWIIESILLTIGLNMSIYVANNLVFFDGNQIIWLCLCVFIYIVLRQSDKYHTKRLKICSIILGMLLAIFQVLGIMTKENWIANEVIITKEIVFFMIAKFVTYTFIFYHIIKSLFSMIEKADWKNKRNRDILKPSLKMFIIVAILFMIAWIPYFLNYYPGITSYDTNYQLMQGYGLYKYNNHHPVLHTFLITLIVKVGYAIAGNYNFGIALCSIFQMLFCAITFSFVIYYMGDKGINPKIKMLTFLFFAFVPFVPQFSIAIWKDVPFTMFMVWFLIGIIEMTINEESFFRKRIYSLIYIGIIFGILFFRNNGVYIILFTLPFILYWKRKYWKRILLIFVLPVVCYYVITGPVFNKLEIAKSSPREMLSIPIQQMARIVKYKSDELEEKDRDLIGQYIKIDDVAQMYNPTISDPIKNEFNEGTYLQDKLNLIKLYTKLAIKFPGETIVAFIGNTYRILLSRSCYLCHSNGNL